MNPEIDILEKEVTSMQKKVDAATGKSASVTTPADKAQMQANIEDLLKTLDVTLENERANAPLSPADAAKKIEAMDIPVEEKDALIERIGAEKIVREPEAAVETVQQKVESPTEKLEKEVLTVREKYLDTLASYNKEKGIWNAWKNKAMGAAKDAKDFFSGVDDKKLREGKHPNRKDVEELTQKYDKARSELVETYYEAKKTELAASGKPAKEVETELKRFRKEKAIELPIQARETVAVNNGRAERMSERKKQLWESTLGKTLIGAKNAGLWTAKAYNELGNWGPEIPIWKKGTVGADGKPEWYTYKTGKLARSLAIGLVGGGAYAGAWLGVRLMRGVVVSTGTAKAMDVMKNRQEKKVAGFEARRTALEEDFAAAKMNLAEYEAAKRTLEKDERVSKRRFDAGRIAVMGLTVGASIGAGYGDHAVHDHLFGHGTNSGAALPPTGAGGPPVAVGGQPPERADGGFGQHPVGTPVRGVPTPHHDKTETGSHPTGARAIAKPTAPATEKSGVIPKEAIIGKGNVSITHAFKQQLEADPELAHKLGYDVAENKGVFLQHLGEKLGYIAKNGDNMGVKAGMGEAFVLHATEQPDGSFVPLSEEYQHGQLVETHHSGDAFETKENQQAYEYVRHGNRVEHSSTEQHHEADTKPDSGDTHPAETSGENPTFNDHPVAYPVTPWRPQMLPSESATQYVDIHQNDAYSDFNDQSAYSTEAYTTPEFIAANQKLVTHVLGEREFLLSPKALDPAVWKTVKNISMRDALGEHSQLTPEIRRSLRKLHRFYRQSKIEYSPGEKVEDYLKRATYIKSVS